MSQKKWALLGLFALLAAAFMCFQNFSSPEQTPSAAGDFNDMIAESQQSQKDIAGKLQQASHPERIDTAGLTNKKALKREVIEESGESVTVRDSGSFSGDPVKKLPNDDKSNLERVSNEIKDSE